MFVYDLLMRQYPSLSRDRLLQMTWMQQQWHLQAILCRKMSDADPVAEPERIDDEDSLREFFNG